jgi:hypothetical protein
MRSTADGCPARVVSPVVTLLQHLRPSQTTSSGSRRGRHCNVCTQTRTGTGCAKCWHLVKESILFLSHQTCLVGIFGASWGSVILFELSVLFPSFLSLNNTMSKKGEILHATKPDAQERPCGTLTRQPPDGQCKTYGCNRAPSLGKVWCWECTYDYHTESLAALNKEKAQERAKEDATKFKVWNSHLLCETADEELVAMFELFQGDEDLVFQHLTKS